MFNKKYKEVSLYQLEIEEFKSYFDLILYNLDWFLYIKLSDKYYYGRINNEIYWNFPRLFCKTTKQLLKENLIVSDGYGNPNILAKRKVWRDYMESFTVVLNCSSIEDFSITLNKGLIKYEIKKIIDSEVTKTKTVTIDFFLNYFKLSTYKAKNSRKMRQEIEKVLTEMIGERLIICFYSIRIISKE